MIMMLPRPMIPLIIVIMMLLRLMIPVINVITMLSGLHWVNSRSLLGLQWGFTGSLSGLNRGSVGSLLGLNRVGTGYRRLGTGYPSGHFRCFSRRVYNPLGIMAQVHYPGGSARPCPPVGRSGRQRPLISLRLRR